MDDEQRLYLWVRVVGSIVLLVTVVLIGLVVVIAPLLDEDYRVDATVIVGITGILTASALALVEVTVRLKRNGWSVVTKEEEKKKEGDDGRD